MSQKRERETNEETLSRLQSVKERMKRKREYESSEEKSQRKQCEKERI